MSILDLILLFLLALFAVRGYFKGLFRETFSLLGLFIGFLAAVRYGEPVSALAQNYWSVSPIILKTVVFIVLFFVVYFAFNLVGGFLHRSAKMLFLTWFNRFGGILLGAGKGAAVLALILFILGSSSFLPKQMRQKVDDSYFAPSLYRLGQGLVEIGRDTLYPRFWAKKNNGVDSGST